MPFRDFDGTSFTPEMLSTLYKAFDLAWADVSPELEDDPARTAFARTTLARAIISIAESGVTDLADLHAAAVAAYNSAHRQGA